jgi:hypothetical protein
VITVSVLDFPLNVVLVYQPNIRLVDQRGGLQHVAGLFAAHVLIGQTPQFLINQGN